jgi:hypothetical protein
MSAPFAAELLGWKTLDSGALAPNSADSSSTPSKALAAKILDYLDVAPGIILPETPSSPGPQLEEKTRQHLSATLPAARPSRSWHVDRKKVIADFSQYSHLRKLQRAVDKNPVLSADLGFDYLISPDVTVAASVSGSTDTELFLHAVVSCKWTIRSDRVQNIRHEFLQMIRHRRGRLPHLVAVTAEPMPSRIAAIARGTGEVDAVYHIAFDALRDAVKTVGSMQQKNALAEIIDQGRLRSYADLADTLATW